MFSLGSDDYVHVDRAVEICLENGWLTEEDIANYIQTNSTTKEFWDKLKKLLEEKGFFIKKIPKNPSVREDDKISSVKVG